MYNVVKIYSFFNSLHQEDSSQGNQPELCRFLLYLTHFSSLPGDNDDTEKFVEGAARPVADARPLRRSSRRRRSGRIRFGGRIRMGYVPYNSSSNPLHDKRISLAMKIASLAGNAMLLMKYLH